MKVAIITCYKQPDYVRAVTLRTAAAKNNDVFVIKNRHRGVLRYMEVMCKLIATRLKYRPDVYLITFRGYEILPIVSLLTWPKKLVFDEFINPLEWLAEPRPEKWVKFVPIKLLKVLYRLLLLRPSVVLADTKTHALYSASLTYGKIQNKFRALPVSTDENTFNPSGKKASSTFKVFYYGNMLPLHGLQHVLAAAEMLKKLPIEFTLVGGSKETEAAVKIAQKSGAKITYKSWVPYKELPKQIYDANLCLGGPFGDTKQANCVITGKTYQFLACAAPTLLGKNSATDQFIDKKNCLLVPLGDSAALAAAITWAYKHPKELSAIGLEGRRLYQKRFSIDAIAPKLESILSVQTKHD